MVGVRSAVDGQTMPPAVALCRCEGERIVFTIALLLVLMTETILRRAIASASAAFLDAWSLSCLAMSSTRVWNPVSTAI
jgi:hypothetical protein